MQMLASLVVIQSFFQAFHPPIPEFPEAGLDDPEAYEGHATRYHRDFRQDRLRGR